ncbi:site-specific integrase [Autumnicola musiva]|uniref:Site-specific integrase n=1 Tax=Autumnicola musiva TaxID=3075589 RepID=A0ABU3D6N8_9FLAO|nr:site-specific integrase [Zunongwangia sp. F117]MDT0677202.1 site-specific integrase [Zunongwangia sp. F117]
MAVNNEWIEKYPFAKFKIRMQKKEREFLSAEELNIIRDYFSSIERLQIVKDLFVFSCYTGIAYCDVMALKSDQMVLGIDKNYWVTKRMKTNNSVRVPLLAPALAIIQKYKDHPRRNPEKLLPSISNQKLNMARHTFATTVTLNNGVPIETVSKILGHTRLATTQIYARVLDCKLSEDMRTLERKLEN